MKIVYDDEELKKYIAIATLLSPEHPILIDKYLENAQEFDVDAISDGETCFVAGIMQHIEEAGIHSGDSACVLPPFILATSARDEINTICEKLAKELKIIGLMNIQFALCQNILYILEVNPRSSRTVPFVSKATGIQLAKKAALLCSGLKMHELPLDTYRTTTMISVKMPVFPFMKFDKVNPFLGPEMRSIGEVMGRSFKLGNALAKALIGAGQKVPREGGILVTVANRDKLTIVPIVRDLFELGFSIYATSGTAKELIAHGINCHLLSKFSTGDKNLLSTVEIIEKGKIQWIINTPEGEQARLDEVVIGQAAIKKGVPFTSSISAVYAFARAIKAVIEDEFFVRPL